MTDSTHTESGTSMVGLDTGLPPAASAPVGKAPTSLIYHVRWYPAATTSPRCLHVLIRRGAQHGRAVVPSTLHCVARRGAWGNSLHIISIEQPRRSILVTCRGRLDPFANSAVLQPKKQFVHMESSRKQNLPPPSAGSVPGWPPPRAPPRAVFAQPRGQESGPVGPGLSSVVHLQRCCQEGMRRQCIPACCRNGKVEPCSWPSQSIDLSNQRYASITSGGHRSQGGKLQVLQHSTSGE
jgi:hypothetical protein